MGTVFTCNGTDYVKPGVQVPIMCKHPWFQGHARPCPVASKLDRLCGPAKTSVIILCWFECALKEQCPDHQHLRTRSAFMCNGRGCVKQGVLVPIMCNHPWFRGHAHPCPVASILDRPCGPAKTSVRILCWFKGARKEQCPDHQHL